LGGNILKTLMWFALAALLALASLAVTATELTGKVGGVSDGDTLTLLVPDGAKVSPSDTPTTLPAYSAASSGAANSSSRTRRANGRGAG